MIRVLRTGSLAVHRAGQGGGEYSGSRAGEIRVPARNPECPGKEYGCCSRQLPSRRKVIGASPCPVIVHLRLRALGHHSQPGW